MKVSYNWLSEYVDVSGYTARELAEKLTRSGIEVDVVESLNRGVSGVVVGYVKSKEKHPDADKLNVCVVDAGTGEDLQIVCGAKNVAQGQKVPVATIGAVLPGDFKIKRAKLRGVESQGMICSAKELGMNDKLLAKEIQEGILVLPEDAEIGADILEVLNLNDEVLELDLTPNRSDALSMLGVAYEIGAIIGRPANIQAPETGIRESSDLASDQVRVAIEAPELCTHYAAKYIENVTIGTSPLWMQNRLMAAGVRPINNVVDITNYVMLEYGQPLHAFDAAKVANKIIAVRSAKQGETIETLDGNVRELDSSMLLITDGTKPIAIAGVMGGANSEVTEETTTIILESAKFAGGSVRKTSRKLGLRSESSIRFEKEVDPARVRAAAERAAALISIYAGGASARGIAEQVVAIPEPKQIDITAQRVNEYLGTAITIADIKAIFDRLQFEVSEASGDLLRVTVPTRRGDISRDVDLIEEIARLCGYDHIPATPITGVTTPGALTRSQRIRRIVRELLTGAGLSETVNYSFTEPQLAETYPGFYPSARRIPLALPMSEDRSVLRTSLVPHLIENAAYNSNRSIDTTAIFEIGNVFVTEQSELKELPDEQPLLAALWTGARIEAAWNDSKRAVDFYDLKGIAEQLLAGLGIDGVDYKPAEAEGLHPGRTADIYLSKEGQSILIGRIGQLHPDLQREKDLKDVFVFEMKLNVLYEQASFDIAYRALPRFPVISRDLAVAVDAGTPVGDILEEAKKAAGALLESIQIFDVYTGDKIEAGKKSVAISMVYRHSERTLTDEEVTEAHGQVLGALESRFGATLRK